MPAQKRKATNQRVTGAKRMATSSKPKTTMKSVSKISAPKEKAMYEKILRDPMSVNTPIALPDYFRGRTCPLVLNHTFSFGKNTAGTHGALSIRPELSSFYRSSGSASLNSALGWNSWLAHPEYSGLANLSSSVHRYRVLAMAVNVQYTGPNQDRGGTITYAFSNEIAGLTLDGTSIPDAHMDSGIIPVSAKGSTFVLRPFDRPTFVQVLNGAYEYINSLTLVANSIDPDDLLVRSRVFIECIPNPESTLADSAVPSPSGGGDVAVPYNTHSVISI